jgi:eukaryotic-like serine/threonine-protein kinase
MPETAQHLLGQLVDGRFPLRRLLGVSANSAVFLTDLPNARPSEPAPEAAIKLIPEDPENAEQQLERWKIAAALSHPGLIRILHFGRCAVDASPCLFVVTELASENLGELLPQRALTPEETSGMMAPVMATLDFLHEKGLVHGGVKPSNILAIRDAIKLSPDRILPAGESSVSWPLAAPYAPPESLLFPASDVWSLGISLYETLTQYLPNHDSSGHYVLPQLPSPFSEVIHGALVQDPTERISLDEIRAALDPAFVPKPKPAPVAKQEPIAAQAARFEPQPETVAVPEPPLAAAAQASAAGAVTSQAAQPAPLPTVDPLSVPLSPVSPNAAVAKAPSHIPVSSLPNVNVTIAAPRRVAGPRASSGSLKYFIIGAAGTLVLAALIVPRLMRNSADSSAPSATAAKPGSTGSAAPVANTPATAEKTAPATSRTAPSVKPTVTTPAPAKSGASSEAKTSAPSNAPAAAPRSAATSSSGAPAVVHQAIPGVSQKARSTIRGTVRINVRVQLNPDGSVSSAALDSPAGSQFFANLALKAARDWRFAPSAISSVLLRFDFTNTDSTAYVVR